MAKFNKEFEDMLAASSDGRPQTINNTTLRDLFANRSLEESKSMTQSKINSATRFFETSGMLDMTPTEITTSSVAFTKMMQGEGYQKLGKSQATKAQAFLSGILEDAGHGSSWPSRTLKRELGREKALEAFDFEVTRAKVKAFPDDVFSKLKQSAIILQNKGDTEAASQLLMHMFGGYRPEDLNGINIEDIDFKTGVVENVEIKGAGETVMKTAVFPPPLLDSIKMHIGERKTGLLFENTQANSARINKVFDGVFGNAYLTVYSKKLGKRQEPMRVKKLRNLNESILSGYDVSDTARKVITLRANVGVAEDYATSASRRKQLEKIVAKNVALFSAASSSTNPAQFLNDVGVTSQSKRTSTISATKEVLEDLGYETAVDDDFFKSLPDSGEVVGGNIAGQVSPELSAALSQQQEQAALKTAEDIEIERGQRSEELASARQATAQAKQQANKDAEIKKGSNYLAKFLGKTTDVGGKVIKGLLPVAIGTSTIAATREAEAQGASPFSAAMQGLAAGASEVVAPPGMAYSDAPFREEQRATMPTGSGLGSRTDVAPQMDAMGYIKPEFASYPMEDAPAPNIPAPVAPKPQMAAQGFISVPEARANAMRKEETTMKDALSRAKGGEVPSFLYGGIVR